MYLLMQSGRRIWLRCPGEIMFLNLSCIYLKLQASGLPMHLILHEGDVFETKCLGFLVSRSKNSRSINVLFVLI